LLAQQAAPYKNKANEASAKLTEFWSSSWQEALQASMNGNAKFRPLVEREVAALREVAEGPHQEFLAQLRAPASTVESTSVSLQELEMARNQVREAPFNKQHLEKLLQIEKQNKNLAMVQYLENRIRQNQKEVQP